MAKITITELEIGLTDYISNEIIPHIPPRTITPFGNFMPIEINSTLMQVIGGVGLSYGGAKLEQFIPTLKRLGIVEEDNKIDVEKFSTTLKEQIEKAGGKLKISDFEFEPADIDILANYFTGNTISV